MSGLPAFMATVMVNGNQIPMEVDPCSVCSIVNLRTTCKLLIPKRLFDRANEEFKFTLLQPVHLAGEMKV